MKKMFKGFRDFILRGNVIDLAVAVVIGAAFNQVVSALVKGIITPLIGVFGGQADFSNFSATVNGSTFLLGDFFNALISFLIVSAVIYFLVVLPINSIMAKLKKGEKPSATQKACPQCLSLIPLKAKRCKFCTSPLRN